MFTSSGSGMFGNKSFTSTGSGFGSTFGTTNTFGTNEGPDGTTIAFEPFRSTDTMIRNGENKEIQTKNMCITSMDQYKMKSIEELRVADYIANRKGNTGSSTTGGLFGANKPATGGGLFGSTTSTGFGQQQSTTTGGGLFGSTATQQSTGSSLFGAAKPSTGLFGSTTSTGFGQQQPAATGSTSLFGSTSTQPTTGSSLFGAAKPATGSLFGNNTTSTGFGTQQTQQPATGGGLFGNTATQQSTGTSLFGAAKPATGGLFGSTTSTGFGQQQPAATGSTSLFGSTSTQPTTGSSLFGAAKPATGGLFGSTTSTGFGQQQAATTGGTSLFGNTSTQPTTGSSLFGAAKPATGGLFGSTTSTGFGQQQPAATGSTSLFGSTSTQPTTGSSLFGAAKPATGSLFGNNTTSTGFGQQQATTTGGTGLFGSTATQPAAGGSLFGAAKPATGGLFSSGTSTFGTQAQQPAQSLMTAPTAVAAAPVQPIYLGGKDDENAIKRAILESQLSSLPYGDSPIIKPRTALPGNSVSSILSKNNDPVQSQLRKLANQALSPSSSGNSSANGNTSTTAHNISNISALTSPNTSFSYKPLVALPSLGFAPHESRSSLNLSLRASPQKISKDNSVLGESKRSNGFTPKSFDISVLKSKSNTPKTSKVAPANNSSPFANEDVAAVDSPQQEPRRRSVCFADIPQIREASISVNESIERPAEPSPPVTATVSKSILKTPESRRAAPLFAQAVTPDVTPVQAALNTSCSPRLNGSILEDEGYYTMPEIEDLERTLKNGKYHVRGGLTVGRTGYGSVFWPGDFELSTIDFKDIISFRLKEVVVYPDDSAKPPLGVDLNRPAEVSLESVWPFDKETNGYVKDPTKLGKLQFRTRLERACQRMDAHFLDYQVATGTWTFKVSHFSKYGLDDDDEPMLTPEQLQNLERQKEQMSKIQRLNIEKRPLPLREIQVAADYSFLPSSGLAGNFMKSPTIKLERKTIEVSMDDDLDKPIDLKRMRLDHEITTELLEKPFNDLKSAVAAAAAPTPTYTRQKLMPRKKEEMLVKVPEEKILRLRYQNLKTKAEMLYLKNVRPHWHPSEPLVLLEQIEPNAFSTKKITVVPLLQDYFKKYLESEGRQEEYAQILKSPALCISPPSVLIELLDAYILSLKRDASEEEEVKALWKALLLSPSSPSYPVQQREQFGNWIRRMLSHDLSTILNRVSDDQKEAATSIIFECLVHGNVKEAVTQAIRFKYYNLAASMSLYNASPSMECREAYAMQHSESARIFKNAALDKYLMFVYQILAGPFNLNKQLRDPQFMECFKELSWMQIVGILIWYGSSPNTLAGLLDASNADYQLLYNQLKKAAKRSNADMEYRFE